MEAGLYFDRLRTKIVGALITYRRLAGNSLALYIDCQPGTGKGYTLWFEPAWNLCDPTHVLAGSRQAYEEEAVAPASTSGFEQVAAAIDILVGKQVTAIKRDSVTGDLTVDCEGGYSIHTFVNDPREDHLWHISDNAARQALYGSPSGMVIEQMVSMKRKNTA